MRLHDPTLLRTLLRNRGMRQQDLADAVTLTGGGRPTRQWVSSLIHGRHGASAEVAEQVAAAVGVSVEHLFMPGRARKVST